MTQWLTQNDRKILDKSGCDSHPNQNHNPSPRPPKQAQSQLHHPRGAEFAALEGANMQTIMDVYDALRSDMDVGEWIERIQGHEWVRVVKE